MTLQELLDEAEVSELVETGYLVALGIPLNTEWEITDEVFIQKKLPVIRISFGETEGGDPEDYFKHGWYDHIAWYKDQPDGDVLRISSSGSDEIVAKCVGGGP